MPHVIANLVLDCRADGPLGHLSPSRPLGRAYPIVKDMLRTATAAYNLKSARWSFPVQIPDNHIHLLLTSDVVHGVPQHA